MKLLAILVITGASFHSCIYDPPKKGVSIFIENQTNDFLYIVPDSLAANNYLVRYDTAYVNGRQYITAKGNYIPPFSKYAYFLGEQHIKNLAGRKENVQNLYIIPGENCHMPIDSIVENNLFRKTGIPYQTLSIDSTYYLFIRKNSIELTTDFDLKRRNDN